MNNKSDYSLFLLGDIVLIIDLNLGNKSVTNDIENVIIDIQKYMDIMKGHVIYKDSDSNYEFITLNEDLTFKCFGSLYFNAGNKDLFKVLQVVYNFYPNENELIQIDINK